MHPVVCGNVSPTLNCVVAHSRFGRLIVIEYDLTSKRLRAFFAHRMCGEFLRLRVSPLPLSRLAARI